MLSTDPEMLSESWSDQRHRTSPRRGFKSKAVILKGWEGNRERIGLEQLGCEQGLFGEPCWKKFNVKLDIKMESSSPAFSDEVQTDT